jgi:hypothetical protein
MLLLLIARCSAVRATQKFHHVRVADLPGTGPMRAAFALTEYRVVFFSRLYTVAREENIMMKKHLRLVCGVDTVSAKLSSFFWSPMLQPMPFTFAILAPSFTQARS